MVTYLRLFKKLLMNSNTKKPEMPCLPTYINQILKIEVNRQLIFAISKSIFFKSCDWESYNRRPLYYLYKKTDQTRTVMSAAWVIAYLLARRIREVSSSSITAKNTELKVLIRPRLNDDLKSIVKRFKSMQISKVNFLY